MRLVGAALRTRSFGGERGLRSKARQRRVAVPTEWGGRNGQHSSNGNGSRNQSAGDEEPADVTALVTENHPRVRCDGKENIHTKR